MSLESNERDAWVADAQRWITRIIGVKQCRINLDDQGEIEEVLVVAGTEKAPRRIVRDVETLLKTRLQMDINYKTISVTQLIDNQVDMVTVPPHDPAPGIPEGDPGLSFHDSEPYFASEDLDPESVAESPPTAEELPPEMDDDPLLEPEPVAFADPIPAVILAEEPSPRLLCHNVGVMSSDQVVRAEVQLQAGDVEALGMVEGPNHADSDMVLVARATVEALQKLLAEPVLLHLKEVRVENLGQQMVVLTAVDLVEGRRSETLFGACSTQHNRHQAVVYAVLDALNRRLSLYGLKSARSES